MLKINELFFSIQGESTLVGWPTVFVRTTGCNLRCTYCDTKYSYHEGEFQSIPDLVRKIQSYPAKHVCVTGGEPLLQKDVFELMTQLCDLGYTVSLETSGSKPIHQVDPRVLIVLDVKTPDSGAADSFDLENLSVRSQQVEYKFVVNSEKDFDWAENFCRQHDLFSFHRVLYSPSFETISPKWLAENILQKKSPARLQLQLHKYIWSPDSRGV